MHDTIILVGSTHNGLIGVDPGNDGLESLLVLSLPHVGVHVPHQRLHVPVLNHTQG
jgi:hypothetical protein